MLPKLAVGDQVWSPDKLDKELILLSLDAKGHQTSPPARYTEASLVKRLEEEGIGRPSTYAPTVATIQRRGYISRQGKALVPSFTAFAVTRLLRNHFGDYVDIGFTAEMEEILDKISNGEKDWLEFLAEFYRGDEEASRPRASRRRQGPVDRVPDHRARHAIPRATCRCACASAATVRSCSSAIRTTAARARRCRKICAPADLTLEKAMALLKAKAQGPKSLGVDPATGLQVYVMHGRFGAYVQLGETPEDRDEKPRRASLGRDYTEETITLDAALKLLSLPRELGKGEDGEAILANLGRFGPYVKHGSEFRSLEDTDDVYTISFERAKELLAQPKKSMRRARQAPKELKALGKHPESGEPVRDSRRPLRPVRDRRHDQRVGAEGHAGRSGDDGRGDRAAERPRRHGRQEGQEGQGRRRLPKAPRRRRRASPEEEAYDRVSPSRHATVLHQIRVHAGPDEPVGCPR